MWTLDEIQKIVYDQLCEFIGTDLEDDDQFDLLTLRVNSLMKYLRSNGVTVSMDNNPYFEFLGLAHDGSYVYSERRF